MTPLDGAVALVTGASRGIGAAVAVDLARRGARCVITARTQAGLEETDDAIRAAGGMPATLLPLDLVRDAETIDTLGPSLVARFGRLDILVHAAGTIGTLTPVAHIDPKDWAATLGLNLTAAWRLIRTCDPPLRAAPAGRAVVLTCRRGPEPYWGLQGASKAGLEQLVRTWANEVAHAPLRITLHDPGAVATRLRGQAYPGEDARTLPQPGHVAPAIADLCLP